MAAPCINDTCSITTSIDSVTRRLQIDARLDPTGGLQCVDGRGLGLEIYGAPAAAAPIDTCFQQLGISTAGEVWSIPQRARLRTFSSSDPVGIPQNANQGNFSSNPIDTGASVTNPFACSALAVITGRFLVRYTVALPSDGSIPPVANRITGAGGTQDTWTPYNADIQCRLSLDGGSSSIVSVYPDTSGIMLSSDVNTDELKDAWHYFAYQVVVAGGASLSLYADARHVGTSGQRNVNTALDSGLGRGFRAEGILTFMPFNGASL